MRPNSGVTLPQTKNLVIIEAILLRNMKVFLNTHFFEQNQLTVSFMFL